MPLEAEHAQPREICWWSATGARGFWMDGWYNRKVRPLWAGCRWSAFFESVVQVWTKGKNDLTENTAAKKPRLFCHFTSKTTVVHSLMVFYPHYSGLIYKIVTDEFSRKMYFFVVWIGVFCPAIHYRTHSWRARDMHEYPFVWGPNFLPNYNAEM